MDTRSNTSPSTSKVLSGATSAPSSTTGKSLLTSANVVLRPSLTTNCLRFSWYRPMAFFSPPLDLRFSIALVTISPGVLPLYPTARCSEDVDNSLLLLLYEVVTAAAPFRLFPRVLACIVEASGFLPSVSASGRVWTGEAVA